MSNASTEESKKPNIGIITHLWMAQAANVPLDNMVAFAGPLANKLYVVTGGDVNSTHDVEIIRIKAKERTKLLAKMLEQILAQMRIVRLLSKRRDETDILIFFMASGFLLPLLFAQALKKKCFIVLNTLGSAKQIQSIRESGASSQFGELIKFHIAEAFEQISYYFADKLIAVSPSVIDQMDLHQYAKKTAIAGLYVLDSNAFDVKTNVGGRQEIVGYVGRLSGEKGVLNFIKAIPEILSQQQHLRFIVIGEGSLQDEIQKSLNSNNLVPHVQLVGWVSHDDLPAWLNKLKLVVIPSYAETGPIIMVESMACGTPVLATPVGSVPDLIEDGVTGFLLESNAPECIARDVIRAISCPILTQISKNGRARVRKEFTRTKASEAWSEILKS
jgi:glycosyltransferase involved in cell wall biosynthesis